jgi:hypothetical protein
MTVVKANLEPTSVIMSPRPVPAFESATAHLFAHIKKDAGNIPLRDRAARSGNRWRQRESRANDRPLLLTGGYRTVAMLALAAGLLLPVSVAWADHGPAHRREVVEEVCTDCVHVQPTARQFAPPYRSDVSASAAREIDALYRELIGTEPATSPGSRSNISTGRIAK